MYETMAINLIPDLSAVAADVSTLGALVLAASATGFAALIPLAARPSRVATPETPHDAELPEAA